MKKSELFLVIIICYLSFAVSVYLLMFPNSIVSNWNNERAIEMENFEIKYDIAVLLNELDTLSKLRYSLINELEYNEFAERDLTQTERLIATKKEEVENLESKIQPSQCLPKLFLIGIAITLSIIPLLSLLRLFTVYRLSRNKKVVKITTNEIADILTYSIGAIIFILIFI